MYMGIGSEFADACREAASLSARHGGMCNVVKCGDGSFEAAWFVLDETRYSRSYRDGKACFAIPSYRWIDNEGWAFSGMH